MFPRSFLNTMLHLKIFLIPETIIKGTTIEKHIDKPNFA